MNNFRHLFMLALLTVLTATVGHAANEPVVVDGVVYNYSNGSYIVTGWDDGAHIQSLHIRSVVNGLDVIAIDDAAFEDNTDIIFLTIDEGITSIGENAFCRCYNLQVAILPEGLETIQEYAFSFCSSLTTVVIPSTVNDIQAQAFAHCNGVSDVYFLMNSEQLGDFSWWDGRYYPESTSEPHGGMEFNTNQHTVIHIPNGMMQAYVDCGEFEAWLPLQEEQEGNIYPLWWIVNYGVVGRDYTISDELLGVYVDKKGCLYAKDDSHWLTPDKIYPGETDYMKTTEFGNHYDQSNWVVLTNVDAPEGLGYLKPKGCILIPGESITGKLLNKRNPIIEVINKVELEAELENASQADYSPNIYIPASFMGRTQHCPNGKTYAFVQPKPQELIHVEWSIYNEDDKCFYQPAPNGQANTQEFKGGFKVSYDLYEDEDLPLTDCYIYTFDAINCHIESNDDIFRTVPIKEEGDPTFTPYVEGGISDTFIVYPLRLTEDPVPTAIDNISTTITTDNRWYNIDGRYLGTTKPTMSGIYINNGQKVVVIQ
jgi:hypothetical protein